MDVENCYKLSCSPRSPIHDLNAIGISGVLAAFRGRALTDEERSAIKEELDDALTEFRDGIKIVDGC